MANLNAQQLSALARVKLSSTECQCFMAIAYYTTSQNCRTARITGAQYQELTGINKCEVSRAVNSLVSRNICYNVGKRIGIQPDTDIWQAGKVPKQLQQKPIQKPLAMAFASTDNPYDEKLSKSTTSHRRSRRSPNGDPRIAEILKVIEAESGDPIASYGKEGAAIKRALSMNYSPEDFLGCWRLMRNFQFWQGQYLPLWKVTENLGFYVRGELKDGRSTPNSASKPKRAMADHSASSYGASWELGGGKEGR